MAEITGSEILARCLKNEGTKDLFFIMGGPMQLVQTTCPKEGIRMIDVRHEQAAALAAQAYARLLQKPGVCMGASGPGTINLTTGQAKLFVPLVSVDQAWTPPATLASGHAYRLWVRAVIPGPQGAWYGEWSASKDFQVV